MDRGDCEGVLERREGEHVKMFQRGEKVDIEGVLERREEGSEGWDSKEERRGGEVGKTREYIGDGERPVKRGGGGAGTCRVPNQGIISSIIHLNQIDATPAHTYL
jgi:hypothetical protein